MLVKAYSGRSTLCSTKSRTSLLKLFTKSNFSASIVSINGKFGESFLLSTKKCPRETRAFFCWKTRIKLIDELDKMLKSCIVKAN